MKTVKDLLNKPKTGIIPPIHFKHTHDYAMSILDESWYEKSSGNKHIKKSFKEHFGKLNVTPKQRKSVRAYTARHSFDINNRLFKTPHRKFPSDIVDDLDETIDNNRIHTRLNTFSSLGFNPEKHKKENNELHSPAYISTTLNKEVAYGFLKKHTDGIHHVAHFVLEKGDPAAYIASASHIPYEDEVLIKRGQTLRHHGSFDIEDGEKKIRIHKLSIVH